ncbi:WD40-repeat-containing domain protein [Pelagophyceae sp. CCMP2097]|nr:WD40-repeat-containing domain protein [Pelagophyceae sp. CCMP2097]
MGLAEDAKSLPLDGLIGFSGSVNGGLVHVHSKRLPGDAWTIFPLGSLVVVKQPGAGGAVAFLEGHNHDVSCLCVSKDGTRLASGQHSHQGVPADVIVWDLVEACEAALAGDSVSGKVLVHRLRQHKGSVQSVGINCDDSLLATLGGRDDNALVIWDLRTGEAICGQPAAADTALNLQWLARNPDRLVTCGSRHLRVWQVDISLPKLHAMDAQMGTLKRVIRCAAVSPDDQWCYAGTTTGEVLKFCIDRDGIQLPNDPDRVRPMLKKVSAKRVGQGVQSIACWVNPKSGNENVIVGAGDGTLLMMNAELNNVAGKNCGDILGEVTSISLLGPSDPTFYVGTSDSNRYRVAVDSWHADLVATAHVGKVKDVVFPANFSDVFVTCSSGGDVRVWNAKKQSELLRIRVPNLECEAVLTTDDGGEIVTGWSDGRIRSFLPESGKLKFVINDAHTDGVTALAAVPNDAPCNAWTLLSGGRDGRIRGWRVTSSHQAMLFSIKEHRAVVNALKVSADGSMAVSASADGSCLSFDLHSRVRKLALFESNIFTNVAWHPDESQLLTTGSNSKITYWDAFDASRIRVVDGSFSDEMTALDIEPKKGAWFVTGSADKTVKTWNYDDGVATACGVGHSKRVNAVKISPDQTFAVSVGDEGGIYIWSLHGLQH